jgi:hypothetical protein
MSAENHTDYENPVEFMADVFAHATAQEQVVQAVAERPEKVSHIIEGTRPSLEFVLGSLDAMGASHGYDRDEIRLLKRDAVIAHITSLRRKRK